MYNCTCSVECSVCTIVHVTGGSLSTLSDISFRVNLNPVDLSYFIKLANMVNNMMVLNNICEC